jgi:hypothetical protein
MGYECKICLKDIKILKNHLKNSHKDVLVDDYFKKFPNEINTYNDFKLTMKDVYKSNSPNSIDFYLKRGLSYVDALEKLTEHRNKNIPFGANSGCSPNQVEYWINKGYTNDESILMVKYNNSRSLDTYIEKFGDILGTEKYHLFLDSLKVRKSSEINNYMNCDNLTYEWACEKYRIKRVISSPRCVEYWMNKKYTYDESLQMVSTWQKEYNPRTVRYWINYKNKTHDEAKNCVSEFQDFNSIKSIMKRYSCTEDDAIELQERIINKMLSTLEKRNLIKPLAEKIEFLKYKILVSRETRKTYRRYKNIINPNNYIRGNANIDNTYHLDHKYSIIQGFLDNIDPKIIGSVVNLELLLAKENIKKNSNCSITKLDLINKYDTFVNELQTHRVNNEK